MRQSWAIAWVLACGCGRFGFEEPEEEPALAVSYPSSDVDAVLKVTEVSLAPTVDGGPVTFGVAPALPEGLALDPDTGVLSGTPAQIADGVTYTITATGARASVRVALRLTVLPGFVVDVIADGFDDDDGQDERCYAQAAGGCSLRAALCTASLRATKQLVLLDARAYALDESLGAVTNDVVIAGRGAAETTIRASTAHAGFGMVYLDSGHTLTLKRATFRDFGPADGAVALVKNGALEADAAGFANNQSAGAGGVIFVRGGARAVLARSTFTGNGSEGGCCGGWGGVIHAEGDGTSVIVRQSTATENTAAWGAFAHISTGSTLRLENSTLHRNSSRIAGTLASPGGAYELINSTIVHNTNTNAVPDSAGIFLYSAPARYTVANTILAFNRDAGGGEHNCHHRTADTTLTSLGGNIVSDGGGNCAAELVGPGDRLAADPGLDPAGPADHGGPTRTIMPIAGSIAIGAAAGCPAEDQRGSPRPAAPAPCDAGAVEVP